MKPSSPYHFFLKHAGVSYNPATATETEQQGRIRGARALAKAERQARQMGYSYQWSTDRFSDSSEWSVESPAWDQWVCVLFDSDGNMLDSLGGIDFGRDGEPWGSPYRRVVEAELALEARGDAK